MKRLLLLVVFVSSVVLGFGQTIALNSFETSGDSWTPLTFSTPPCTSGADRWDYSTSLSSITPSDGSQFWGVTDLQGNCGGASFETITLPNVDVSAFTSVTWSMDYNVIGFDNGDDIKYELFHDNVSQGEVILVDGSSNFNTGGWLTETVNIPASVTNVSVIIYVKQNGGDYCGIDRIILEGTSTGPTITTSGTPVPSLDYFVGNGPSPFESFIVEAANFVPLSDVTLTVPVTTPQQFAISTNSGTGYTTSLVIPTNAMGELTQNIYTRLESGLGVGTYTGDVTITGGPGATPATVSLSGEVTQPEVNFTLTSASISETGVSYNMIVTSDVVGSHTVDVVASGGSATNGTEYSFTNQTLDFSSSTSQNVLVTINDDAVCVGDQNVIFSLTTTVNCAIGANNQLDLLITDDEQSITPIDFQGFEGGGWVYDPSPMSYNVSSDTWDIVSSIGGITPSSGSNFWGMEDLNNGNGGGNFDHVLSFSKDITLYSDVVIEFKWQAIAYNTTDEIRYEVFHDAVSQGVVDVCNSTLCPGGWNTVSINIPNSVSVVDLDLIAFQNGGSQYGGFDDVQISGLSCSTCSEPTTASVFSGSSPTMVTTTSANVSWNIGGDGENSLVLMRAGSAVGSSPIDNNSYNANSVFGAGDPVGTGGFVIYNGNGNNVVVTGLTPGVEYFTEIFEYNCLPGAEDYLTSSSSTDAFVSVPEVVDDFSTLCVTDNSIEFSWNDPLVGNHDGFLLVARENAGPHAVQTALDPNAALGDNLNYTAAATYGTGANLSRVLYKGNGNNVTVTGLTEGTSYTFAVYSYALGTAEYRYSSSTTTSQTINQMDVPTYGGFAGDTQVNINWTLPPTGCWDEIMITADGIAGVQQVPTGDGSAYTGNTSYGSGTAVGPTAGFVVYKGTGTSTVITSLTNNTAYSFEIFVRNGSQWSQGKEIILVPSAATILEPGDLAIIAVNTNIDNTPSISDDEVCYVSYREIQESTAIDFTDNGYERSTAGLWGGTEGTIRMQRTGGGPIPAGQPICIQGKGNDGTDFDVYLCGVLDNANWTIENLNTGNYNFDTNVDDQIWIMQGGAWTGGSGSHNGFYSGNVLYGWTAVGWEPMVGYNDTKGSTMFPGAKCFTTNLNGLSNHEKAKYTGPMTNASQYEWIARINDVANWTGYATNAAYFAASQDYSGSCITFNVTTTSVSDGIWTGVEDDQWFECGNWSTLRVPDDSMDVFVPASTPTAVIDQTHVDADLAGGIASARELEINNGTVEVLGAADLLKVNKTLYIDGSGSLFNQNGGNIEVYKNLEIDGNGKLDMNSSGATSTFTLHENWFNSNLGASPNDGFIENNSTVIFAGIGITQDVESDGLETFGSVEISKGSATPVVLDGTEMGINDELNFNTGGFIDATNTSSKVIINNTNSNAIIGYEPLNGTGNYSFDDKYVEGTLERNVLNGSNYDFPIGARPSALNYHPINMDITGGSGYVSAIFDPVDADGERRKMNYFDNTNLCAGTPTIVNYQEFSNLGYWNIEGPSGMGYTVTIHPNSSTNAPNPSSANGEYKVIKANAGTGSSGADWPYDQSQNTGPCVTTDNYYAAVESFIGFSDFALISVLPPSVVLPIELLSFEAKTQDRDIVLDWITETEINNERFNLYHSVDGTNWEIINVQNGAGNSVETMHYSFVHRNPTWGVHYYQLEQVDFDGQNTFSGIVAAEIGFDSDISLYPIPAEDVLYIDASYDFESELIQIHNDQGQKVSAWTFNNGQIDIQGLSNGVYFISFTGLKSQVVKKFIKASGR